MVTAMIHFSTDLIKRDAGFQVNHLDIPMAEL